MIDIGLTQMSGYGTGAIVMIVMTVLGVVGLIISNNREEDGFSILFTIVAVISFLGATMSAGMLGDAGKENHDVAQEWVASSNAEKVCVNEFTRRGSDSPRYSYR